MAFTTPLTSTDPATLVGPARRPRQMLAEQSYGGHASLHDGDVADGLGLAGAPIEGPTHFSQFDPLAFEVWGSRWFETGCISAHFMTMVVEGEEVTGSLSPDPNAPESARINAIKPDGAQVLTGTASIDPNAETELDVRLAKTIERGPGELFVADQMEVGQRSHAPATVSVDMSTPNGNLYPFSLRSKLDAITEPSPWYETGDNPWGRPIIPFEMISVLSAKAGTDFLVRGPSVGLFLDLEIKLIDGPLFVGHDYVVEREVVALGQSRRTESNWVRSTLTDAESGDHVASVLLHSGVFKESYAAYPIDRLA